jgi:phage tail sheath protein FI
MIQSRGDSMTIVDIVGKGANILSVTNNALAIDNSYVATYWPWTQTIDPNTGQQVWVPASTLIPGVYAFNDSLTDPWHAPAGTTRGVLSNVITTERNLTQGNRDSLYRVNVNGIATFPNSGVVVFGQKTLQKKTNALDRVGVRRLLIEIKSYISQIANNLVFEQNTENTRNSFLAQVNPYLNSIKQREGLDDYKVIMDTSNNTPTTIDNNQLIGQIYLQPTKTIEFIILDFNILPSGVSIV